MATHLFQKPGESTWYVRMILPPAVRHAFGGRSKLVKTTGTSNKAEAMDRRLPILALWKQEIQAAKDGKTASSDLWRQDLADKGTELSRQVDTGLLNAIKRPQKAKGGTEAEILARMAQLERDKASFLLEIQELEDAGATGLVEAMRQRLETPLPSAVDVVQEAAQVSRTVSVMLAERKYGLSPGEVEEAAVLTTFPSTYKPVSPLTARRLELFRAHRVKDGIAVIARIIKLIGEPSVLAVVESRKIQPAKRHALVLWLREHLSRDNPEHEKHFQVLDTATATVLTAIKREVMGQEPSSGGWKPQFSEEFPVLMEEWERIARAYRPELLPPLERLRFIEANTSRRFYVEFNQDELQTIFAVLHGKSVSALAPLIAAQLAKALSHGLMYMPTPELKALQPSEPAPRVIGNFARELDGEVIDLVPHFPVQSTHVDDVPSWSI